MANVRAGASVHAGVGEARHSEIKDLGLPGAVHKDVARLEIAVNDSLLMGMVDGRAHLNE